MPGSIDRSAVSAYNHHPTTGYSPLPVTVCDIAWISLDVSDLAGNPSTE